MLDDLGSTASTLVLRIGFRRRISRRLFRMDSLAVILIEQRRDDSKRLKKRRGALRPLEMGDRGA
jgi:hypothetical protein